MTRGHYTATCKGHGRKDEWQLKQEARAFRKLEEEEELIRMTTREVSEHHALLRRAEKELESKQKIKAAVKKKQAQAYWARVETEKPIDPEKLAYKAAEKEAKDAEAAARRAEARNEKQRAVREELAKKFGQGMNFDELNVKFFGGKGEYGGPDMEENQPRSSRKKKGRPHHTQRCDRRMPPEMEEEFRRAWEREPPEPDSMPESDSEEESEPKPAPRPQRKLQSLRPSKAEYLAWKMMCDTFFNSYRDESIRTTRFPIVNNGICPDLSYSKCLQADNLRCCVHDLERILQGGGRCNSGILKKERLRWHPDRFSIAAEKDQLKAKEMFQMLQALMH